MVPPTSRRIPRVPRYSGCCPFPSPSPTGLSPSPAGLSRPVRLVSVQFRQSITPENRSLPVWALPLSLAATQGISVDFFSSGYLDVSLHRVPSVMPMDSACGDGALPPPGFPIRTSADLCLFAAPRGFSQLTASFFGVWCQGILPVLTFA